MGSCLLVDIHERMQFKNHNGWIPIGHTYEELKFGVLNNIHNYKPVLRHQFRLRGLHRSHWPKDKYRSFKDEDEVLKDYWEIFNKSLFSDSLTPVRSYWRFVRRDEKNWKGYDSNRRYGDTKENRYHRQFYLNKDSFRYYINAHISVYEQKRGSPKERLRVYIQTLLHEMIHAFIQNYACLCDQCKVDYAAEEGKTSHGEAWQTIAYKVENFVKNELGLDLDLNRVVAVAGELDVPGFDLSSADLSIYNVDPNKLAERLAALQFHRNEASRRVSDGSRYESSFSSDGSLNGEHENGSGDDSEDHRFCPGPDDSSSNEYDDGPGTTSDEDSNQEDSREEH